MEFQDCRLEFHEHLQKRLEAKKQELAAAHKEAVGVAAPRVKTCAYKVKVAKENFKRHKGMLPWIEEQRRSMVIAERERDGLSKQEGHGSNSAAPVQIGTDTGRRRKRMRLGLSLEPVSSKTSKRVT